MDELEEIKLRKMQELQQSQVKEEMQMQQQIQQLEMLAKQIFTKEALERYGNLKTAHPEKAVHVLTVIAQMLRSGKADKIDDQELKELLKQITPKKKEFSVSFK